MGGGAVGVFSRVWRRLAGWRGSALVGGTQRATLAADSPQAPAPVAEPPPANMPLPQAGTSWPVHALETALDLDAIRLRQLLGGKGAGLLDMRQRLGLPVPPGFVLGTPLCRRVLTQGWPAGLDAVIERHLADLEGATGQRLGDAERPLLVSVRSGAPVSMPGMMDTVLNLGANRHTIDGLARGSGRLSFALDTWWRFCRMYAVTVLEVPQALLPAEPGAQAGEDERRAAIEDLRALCAGRGTPIPDDPRVQLRQAIEAVFRSSRSPRARVYREREGIRDEVDTAVIVQAMVFGNLGPDSGTGVAFSRNPSTGDPQPYGDFLPDAQGEDVVAGVRASLPLGDMRLTLPEAHARLLAVLRRLERHYRDLCDVEFTVQRGSLYVLQVRIGKRSAEAAVRIAVDLAQDPEIGLSRGEALARVSAEQIRQLQNQAEVAADTAVLARGVAAAPGVGCGRICTDPDRAAQWSARGDPVILVRPTTAPQDVHGMVGSVGVVTATGGLVSHAALVARGWGIPAVCGVRELRFEPALSIGGEVVEEGEWLTIDGARGTLHRGRCAMASRDASPYLAELKRWATQLGLPFGESAPPQAAGPRPDPAPVEPAGSGAPDALAASGAGDPVFALLRALALCGVARPARLAESLALPPDALAGALAALPATLVQETPRGLQLTPAGRQSVSASLAQERCGLDGMAIEAAYRRFLARDVEFKTLVARWQLRIIDGREQPNDHADADHDAAVFAALADLHVQTRDLVAAVIAQAPRLAPFAVRFDRAAQGIARGDGSLIASPLKDSYHTVWFEFHEELIHLCGRDRAVEESRPE
jgi:pyruvate,orthophosphate dikinase